jgi:voltage-gated potassium channel
MKQKIELIIIVLTALSVFVIIFDYIFNPSGTLLTIIYVFDFAVVVILALDFYFRAKESPNKRRFILTHCYEIPALVPMVVFGLLESDPIYDVAFRSLRLVRLFRLIVLFSRSARVVESTNNRILYTILLSSMAVTIGAIAIYFEESNVEGTKITSLGDAFWWAIVTVTTVGYGDVYPVTTGGRVIGSFLMISGIAILGVLISTLGAGLIESRMKKNKVEDDRKKVIKERIDVLEFMSEEEINTLNISINTLHRDLNRSRTTRRVVTCSKCKHPNLDGSLYCNMCGQALLHG